MRSAPEGFTSDANQYQQAGPQSIPMRILTVDSKNSSPTDIRRLPVIQLTGNLLLDAARAPEGADSPGAAYLSVGRRVGG
jgi:hypothetical protein